MVSWRLYADKSGAFKIRDHFFILTCSLVKLNTPLRAIDQLVKPLRLAEIGGSSPAIRVYGRVA